MYRLYRGAVAEVKFGPISGRAVPVICVNCGVGGRWPRPEARSQGSLLSRLSGGWRLK